MYSRSEKTIAEWNKRRGEKTSPLIIIEGEFNARTEGKMEEDLERKDNQWGKNINYFDKRKEIRYVILNGAYEEEREWTYI